MTDLSPSEHAPTEHAPTEHAATEHAATEHASPYADAGADLDAPPADPGSAMPRDLLRHARATKGFMPEREGLALHALARQALPHGPALEVGTYCGKSAVYLGAAAREVGGTVFTVDHHRGSEENQAGWEHHDAEVVDAELDRMDTLPFTRRTLARAGLEEQVVVVVGRSTTVAAHWRTPLAMLFIDGGHAEEHAHADLDHWAPWVAADGLLVIHDVFPDPADGGRPPYDVFLRALDAGFEEVAAEGSLRALRRRVGGAGDPLRTGVSAG